MWPFVLTIPILLVGCSVADPTDEIRQTLDEQVRAWNRGSIDGFMSAYSASDELTFIAFPSAAATTQPTVTRGWAGVRDRYRRRYPDAAAMGELHFKDLDIGPVDRKSAIVTGRYEVRRGVETLRGVFVLDMVNTKDGWKIVRDRTYPD